MVDIIFAIFDVHYDCRMIGFTCFRVMLDNQVSYRWLSCLSEIPFLRILYEIFAVGASMVLVVKCSNSVDARLKLLT